MWSDMDGQQIIKKLHTFIRIDRLYKPFSSILWTGSLHGAQMGSLDPTKVKQGRASNLKFFNIFRGLQSDFNAF